MFDYRRYALQHLSRIGPRYLPFADVATEDVPLSRLLRLSLFQVTVGMALVLLVGTLNRVMIVELNVPARTKTMPEQPGYVAEQRRASVRQAGATRPDTGKRRQA